MLVKRKWGWYVVLWETLNTKWKLLFFPEGSELSMQRHRLRAEKWWVLAGKCGIHNDNDSNVFDPYLFRSGDVVDVPMGNWHKLAAWEFTIVLEKQYGELCEEWDIERV